LWHEEKLMTDEQRSSVTALSCKFADRCPHAMTMCLEKQPPLFQTNPRRAAACYLYRDAAAMKSEEMDKVLAVTSRTSSGPGPASSAV
jgi:hypothetical protein